MPQNDKGLSLDCLHEAQIWIFENTKEQCPFSSDLIFSVQETTSSFEKLNNTNAELLQLLYSETAPKWLRLCKCDTTAFLRLENAGCTIFVNWKKTFWTNKLEYCVLESERTLRVLHLMFAHADSPDRMSNSVQGSQLEDDERSLWKLSQVRRTAPPQPRIRTQYRIDRRNVASD